VLKVTEQRRKQQERLVAIARTYAWNLRRLLGPLTAILYGSVARGDFNLGSDVDILIISEELPSDPVRRTELLYSVVEPPLEPKGYTPEEFRALLNRRHSVLMAMLQPHIVLMDDLQMTREEGFPYLVQSRLPEGDR